MPATKPTKPTVRNPQWGTDPGVTLDPGATREALGWEADDQPPARWWNWLENAFSLWSNWAEAAIDVLFADKFDLVSILTATWAGLADDEPRLRDLELTGDTWRLWIEATGPSANLFRLYSGAAGFAITQNLAWDTGTNAWVTDGPGTTGFFALSPRTDVVNLASNTLYPSLYAKAVGRVDATGGVVTKTTGSRGLVSVTMNALGITVTMDEPMASVDYFVLVSNANTAASHNFSALVNGVSQFTVTVRDDAGAIVDPTANDVSFSVAVFGIQAQP